MCTFVLVKQVSCCYLSATLLQSAAAPAFPFLFLLPFCLSLAEGMRPGNSSSLLIPNRPPPPPPAAPAHRAAPPAPPDTCVRELARGLSPAPSSSDAPPLPALPLRVLRGDPARARACDPPPAPPLPPPPLPARGAGKPAALAVPPRSSTGAEKVKFTGTCTWRREF
jgi:hypothetical protein